MALINITPLMTSNTTPSPYVVSASSVYGSVSQPWKAFDNLMTSEATSWLTAIGNVTGWIKIDFSIETRINAFSVGNCVSSISNQFPKSIILYGSNDDLYYDYIKKIDSQILWDNIKTETRLYNLDFSVTYRYYKIMIVENNGNPSYSAIGEIKFWQDDGITPTESSKTVSRRYTLPFGSKLRLDNLTSDLSYMLATENDGDNFGTLRVVNEAGKFEIAKSGQKIRKLWGGVVTTVSTLTLEDNIENYSSIVLVANYATGSGVIEGKTAQSYPVVESSGSANEFLITLSLYSDSTAKAPYIYFKMEGNQLNITAIGTGGFSQLPRLVSIYGVY